MEDILITFNMGSSTLKAAAFALGEIQEPLFRLTVELASGDAWTSGRAPADLQGFEPNMDVTELVAIITSQAPGRDQQVAGVVHRIIHGGPHREPLRVDDELLEELQNLEVLCPLCQPPALEAIFHLRELWPDLPQYAVFDTSFHRQQQSLATSYALPASLRLQGITAYGFHGISCQHVMRRLRQDHPELARGRVLIAHLGNSASLAAVQDGQSVASTMGFSQIDGLPGGTRSGQIDPGVLLYLMELGWNKSRITDLLYHQSGLLGLSGVSGDMRELIAHKGEGAKFAIEYFCYRAARLAASLACAMEGLDTIVFTGGVGAGEPLIREKICHRLGWMGVELDSQANQAGHHLLAAPTSRTRLLVVPTDEEAEMTLQCEALVREGAGHVSQEALPNHAGSFSMPR